MVIKVPEKIIELIAADCVEQEAINLASFFHYGKLGITLTLEEARKDAELIRKKGYILRAFDTEMTYAPLAIDLLGDRMNIHVPISYPMGNITTRKKLLDLEYIAALGVDENCVCLNYFDILSHNYNKVEQEVKKINQKFGDVFKCMAFVIPAGLLNDSEIVKVCKAIENGGGKTIKVNPGFQLGVTPEEILLIQRNFGDKFDDIHPSGNIRTLEQVAEYLKLGVTTIHSSASLDIIDEFISIRKSELQAGGSR